MIWLLLNVCGGMELCLNDFELFTILEVIHNKVSGWVIEPHFFNRGCVVQSCYATVNVLRLSWWKSSQCKGWVQKQTSLISLFFLPTWHRLGTSGKGELQLRQCPQQTGLKTRDCRGVFLIWQLMWEHTPHYEQSYAWAGLGCIKNVVEPGPESEPISSIPLWSPVPVSRFLLWSPALAFLDNGS